MKAELLHAYLLHRRIYSDSQLMLDMLVEGVGHICLLARVNGKQALKKKAQLQPFQQLLISYAGKGDLKYLTQFEFAETLKYGATGLAGKTLYCGFYLNELSHRIVPVNEPIEDAYTLYKSHLFDLFQKKDLETCLRSFEFQLLELLGYGIDFSVDAEGEMLKTNTVYQYYSEIGWVQQAGNHTGFSGKQLLAISQCDFSEPHIRNIAKQLSRYLLKPLLGDRPLKSRELFL